MTFKKVQEWLESQAIGVLDWQAATPMYNATQKQLSYIVQAKNTFLELIMQLFPVPPVSYTNIYKGIM